MVTIASRVILAGGLAACLLWAPAVQAQEQSAAMAGSRWELTNGIRIDGRFFPYQIDSGWAVGANPSESVFTERPISVSLGARSTRESRLWRTVGAFSDGAVGFRAYLPYAITDGRIASTTQRTIEWSFVTAGAAYLGYLIGREFDR